MGTESPLHVFAAYRGGVLPRADFHMHTNWTDGETSARQMHEAAIQKKMEAVLFSEHARATSSDWFPRFAAEVRALSRDICRAYVGAEVKVLNTEGTLDICDEIRRECDLIMASVHRFPGEVSIYKGKETGYSEDQVISIEFELARGAVRKGGFDILGHPFGMTYKRFQFTPPDNLVRELMKECAIAGIAFEINARYHPNPGKFLAWCGDAATPISLGSNAHSTSEIGSLLRILTDSRQA
jgi:histidinol phosphatase-like PHP family hydrolase